MAHSISRLERELADTLGLVQAVRGAAADAASRVESSRAQRRLTGIDDDLAALQEEVNALVVSGPPAARAQLTSRARRLRETESTAQDGRLDGADGLDALQALAAEAAFALTQWQVVRRFAKAEGHDAARRLARRALPLAERHLETALDTADRLAKRQAKSASAD